MSFPAKVGFRASNNFYFRAEGGGGQIVGCSGTSMGAWETFTVLDRGNNQLALQVANGMYVSAQNGGGGPLFANATAITPSEIFTIIDRGAGQVALQAQNGMYLRADSAMTSIVTANATTIGATETFAMIDPGVQLAPRFGTYDFTAPLSLPAAGRGAVSFTAMAQRDVYVGISSALGAGSQMYEIVFAGPGGPTVLRRGRQGPELASSPAGLLSPGGSNPLWVAIDAGTQMIQVGRGTPGQDPILMFRDPQFNITAQFVAFSCGDTAISLSNVQVSSVSVAPMFTESPPTAVHLGNPPKLNIQNRISVAAWIFPTTSDGLRDIVAHGFAASPQGEVFLRIQNGSYQFGALNSTGEHKVSVAMPAGDVNTWVHLAGIYDGSKWILYRNGISVGEAVDSIGAVPVNAGWSIGTRGDALERLFRGKIMAVSIWNTAIDATLLQACMACSLIGLEPGLVGYWPLNDGGAVAVDKTPAPANGTMLNVLWMLGTGPTLAAAPPPVIAPPPIQTPFEQDKWNRCSKCKGMFYGPVAGACSAGGTHDATGSFNYHMFGYARPDGQGQHKWYWCRKCSGFFYWAGVGAAGSCAAGNTHDNSASAEYVAVMQELPSVTAEAGWQWCSKCQLLSYGGASNVCPAGGNHASIGSANYVVRYGVTVGTGTGTAQPSSGLPPPTGDPIVDNQLMQLVQSGVPFSIFGVPFTMPFRFSGALTTTTTVDSVDIIGSAHLDSPFSTDVGQLEVKISRTAGASAAYLRFDLPLSLSSIVQSQVQPKVPAEAWSAINAVAMPLVRSFDAPTVVLSPINGSDPALPGPIVAGINFYKSIPLSSIEPFTTLHATFPILRLNERSIGAHLGIGRDNGAVNWQGDLMLTLNQSLGTDLVVFKSISMMVKPGVLTMEAGCKALFTVRVSNSETLNITGGINLKQTAIGSSASLWGALDAADGEWRDPLGLKGLTIKGLGVEIGASTVFPNFVVGFRGDVMIGSSALRAALAFFFDPADLGATVLQIASPEGIGLLTIIKALVAPLFSVPSFLDIAITDLNFYIAPKGGNIAGKVYPRGTQIGGKLNLLGYRASVDGTIDYTSGMSLHGTMDRISLRAGSVTFIELTDMSGSGNPTVDIDANTRKQGIHISGRLRVFDGFYSEAIEADISSSGMFITLSSSAGGIFASTTVKLDQSGFLLHMEPGFNFGFTLFGIDFSVGVTAKIDVAISAASFSQSIGFKFHAFGVDVPAGSLTLTVPICTMDELRNLFEQFADKVKDFFKDQLVNALQVALEWLRDNVTMALNEAGQFLRSAGVAIADAARTIANVFRTTAQEAARAVARTVDEAVDLLRNTFGLGQSEIDGFVSSVGNVFSSGLSSVGDLIGLGGGSSAPMLPLDGFFVYNSDYFWNRQWLFDAPGSGSIAFTVRNSAAAKIGFAASAALSGPMYEIEIGADMNRQIYVRKSRGGAVVASAPFSMNMGGDRLWAGIDNSRVPALIQVGRGEVGTNVLLSFFDSDFVSNAQHVLVGRSSVGLENISNVLAYWDITAAPVETRLSFLSSPATAVQLGNPAKLDIRGPISVSAWIRPLAINGLRDIVARGYALNPNGELFLRIHEGNYQFGSWNNTGDHKVAAPIPVGDLGSWVHLTGTYDGTAWTLYHNGHFLARAQDSVGAVAVNGGWAIGSTGDRSDRCFIGNIAEVTIWNKAIDMATIDTLIQRKVVTPSEGLKGYWPLGQTFNACDMAGGFANSSLASHTMNVNPPPSGLLGGTPSTPADGTLVSAAWTLVPPMPQLRAPSVENALKKPLTHTPPPPAKRTFPWTGVGGGLLGNPSITSCGPGRLDVFSRGLDNVLYHVAYVGAWRQWEGLGGQMTSDPSACSRAANQLDCYSRAPDNTVQLRSFDGANWQGFAQLGGSTVGTPTGVGTRSTQRDFFALGTDKAIWWRHEDTAWRALTSLGGGLLDPPAAIHQDGMYHLFARGLDNAVYYMMIFGSSPGTWMAVGGALSGPPAAAPTVGANRCFDLFGRGTDQRVWTCSVNPNGSSNWRSLAETSGPDPGLVLSDPVGISIASNRVDVVVRGADEGLWHRRRVSGVWQPWRRLGSLRILSKPTVTSCGPGRIDIAVYNTDKGLWHYRMED